MRIFFQRYFFLVDKQAKKQLPFLLFIFISSSFLDVIGLGLVGAFLLLVVNFNQVMQKLPHSIQAIFQYTTPHQAIFMIGISLIAAFIVKGFWGIYSQRKIVLFSSQFTVRLKKRLMQD